MSRPSPDPQTQSPTAWEDTAPMPKLEPALAWPPSPAAAGAIRRPLPLPLKPTIQGLEVKELESQTVFDQLFGDRGDAAAAKRTAR